MLLISATKSSVPKPIFSGGSDFGFSMLLAFIGGFQVAQGIRFLTQKEKTISAALLILFCAAQFIQFALSMRPSSPVRIIDGRMNLNAETAVSSPWHVVVATGEERLSLRTQFQERIPTSLNRKSCATTYPS